MNIKQPTLIIDKARSIANIKAMFEKAKKHNLIFRPHFKTHQMAEVGEWFRNEGVEAITVSSVSMAKYFADNGWKNITIAFPANIHEATEINALAKKIELNIIADNIFTVQYLNKNLTDTVGIFIEIDTGHHRSGIEYNNFVMIDELLKNISSSGKLEFKGFLTHSGHSYLAKSKNEIEKIHNDALKKINFLKKKYSGSFPSMLISTGDTPCCSICNIFEGIDEIRPGNFVFYDIMQYFIGSCDLSKIAVSVACPVVSINKERNEFIVYCGAIHLSKDYVTDNDNKKIFGLVVEYNENGWSEPIANTYVSSLSQEHGVIKTTSEFINKINTGSIIGILPTHSCLSVHQLKDFHTEVIN
ncbi:MAG TPA: alanine racemase [Bacteroidales bacterium]|nr:alanine racemase [Bacteroidales bacterium]HPS18310.1 alanine racemase [Bacteroidales bacterium]